MHAQRGDELKWWRCRDQRNELWAVCLELPHRRSPKQTAHPKCAYLRMVHLPDLLADVGLWISGEVEVPTDGHVRTARGIRRRAPTVVGPPIPEQRQTPDAESPISLCGVSGRGELKRHFDTILILYEAECGCPHPLATVFNGSFASMSSRLLECENVMNGEFTKTRSTISPIESSAHNCSLESPNH